MVELVWKQIPSAPRPQILGDVCSTAKHTVLTLCEVSCNEVRSPPPQTSLSMEMPLQPHPQSPGEGSGGSETTVSSSAFHHLLRLELSGVGLCWGKDRKHSLGDILFKASTAGIKHHGQEQQGQERVYFILYLMAHHLGKLG